MKIIIFATVVVLLCSFYESHTVLSSLKNEKKVKSSTKHSKLADSPKPEVPKGKKMPSPFMRRFRDNMKELATRRLKSENFYQKRLQSGQLPEGFPESMVKEAKKFRENKDNWKHLMAFPTEVWRGCLYPPTKMNYLSWCRSLYASKTELELKCNC